GTAGCRWPRASAAGSPRWCTWSAPPGCARCSCCGSPPPTATTRRTARGWTTSSSCWDCPTVRCVGPVASGRRCWGCVAAGGATCRCCRCGWRWRPASTSTAWTCSRTRPSATTPAARPAASRQPADLVAPPRVPDERRHVQEGVGDHERHHPPDPEVEQREQHAHGGVAEEAAEALIEVVGAPQQGVPGHHGRGAPAERLEPGQQVADPDDLLHQGVLEGR